MTNSQQAKLESITNYWKAAPSVNVKISHYLGDDGKLYVRVALPYGGADRYTVGKRGATVRWSEK